MYQVTNEHSSLSTINHLQFKCLNNAWVSNYVANFTWLTQYPFFHPSHVQSVPQVLPDGTSIPVTQKATVNITKTLDLQDLLCVLSFSVNL